MPISTKERKDVTLLAVKVVLIKKSVSTKKVKLYSMNDHRKVENLLTYSPLFDMIILPAFHTTFGKTSSSPTMKIVRCSPIKLVQL